jgi:hypothetical protein
MFEAETEVKKLQEELKEQAIEIHQLQRQQSSRRGPEGRPGEKGDSIKGDKGDKGDPGTVSREQAIALFREVIHEHGNELMKEIVSAAVNEIKKLWLDIVEDLRKVDWNAIAYGDKNPFPPKKAKSAA